MANKNPSPKTRFKKGRSGNPGGQPKLPDDIKEARKFNQIELERSCNRLLYLTRDELKAVMACPSTQMLDLIVSSIIGQAMQKGDQQRLEWIAMRLIGRVTEKVEVTTPEPYVVRCADGSTVELGVGVGRE